MEMIDGGAAEAAADGCRANLSPCFPAWTTRRPSEEPAILRVLRRDLLGIMLGRWVVGHEPGCSTGDPRLLPYDRQGRERLKAKAIVAEGGQYDLP